MRLVRLIAVVWCLSIALGLGNFVPQAWASSPDQPGRHQRMLAAADAWDALDFKTAGPAYATLLSEYPRSAEFHELRMFFAQRAITALMKAAEAADEQSQRTLLSQAWAAREGFFGVPSGQLTADVEKSVEVDAELQRALTLLDEAWSKTMPKPEPPIRSESSTQARGVSSDTEKTQKIVRTRAEGDEGALKPVEKIEPPGAAPPPHLGDAPPIPDSETALRRLEVAQWVAGSISAAVGVAGAVVFAVGIVRAQRYKATAPANDATIQELDTWLGKATKTNALVAVGSTVALVGAGATVPLWMSARKLGQHRKDMGVHVSAASVFFQYGGRF